MVKIKIKSNQPFSFLDHEEPKVLIVFTADDVRTGNRERVVSRWRKSLTGLAEAGYIEREAEHGNRNVRRNSRATAKVGE